ncbi:MAG TPA: O-methyltransferase [bacterium]|nr:O-methyltransferase [bacterium]
MVPVNHPEITRYLTGLASKYDEPVVNAMEAYGHKRGFPIIDRLCGAMIHLLALSVGAKKVFELGSGFGYSAYWFSKAVGLKGKIWCTDGDPENRDRAEAYLKKAGFWKRVNFGVGDAVTQLNQTPGAFDIVYNDIDKHGYPAAWEAAKTRIRPGGLYICDNTLWSGRVAEKKVKEPDYFKGWTAAIKDHNKRIYKDKNFDATLIPLRDGVLVARRKA